MSRTVGSTITIGRKDPITRRQTHNGGAYNHDHHTQTQHQPPEPSDTVYDALRADLKEPIAVTIWLHELRTSDASVLVDVTGSSGIKSGQVFELMLPETLRRLYFTVKESMLKQTGSQSTDETGSVDSGERAKVQVSLLSTPLQKALDVQARSTAHLKFVADVNTIEADSVEIFTKDVNLSRDSQWRLSQSLVGSCLHAEQRVLYLNNRTGVVRYVYRNGKSVFSGYVGENTKFVFRSESAKLTVLIQLSNEMWHFEENGEIMFHKLVNNLFPKILKKWRNNNAHHSITIVLFTSVDLTNIPWTTIAAGERPNKRRDYFRVVVDQVNILSWDKIMANLRLEFANFKRDIMLKMDDNEKEIYTAEGDTLPAVKGNILEAVSLALLVVSHRFRNLDLKYYLNHFIVVTPGTGIFDVDYELMLETSRKFAALDCGLDIVSLSQPPLHIAPLFRAVSPAGKLTHCVPNWCDISFYRDTADVLQWKPRCKMYELQMMGVMENEANELRVDRLHLSRRSILDAMDVYDADIFKPVKKHRYDEYFDDDAVKAYEMLKSATPSLRPADSPLPDASSTLALMARPRREEPTKKEEVSGTSRPDTSSTDAKGEVAIKNKAAVATTTSAATGMVTKTMAEVSALSSLYVLNKYADERTTSSAASVRSMTPSMDLSWREKAREPTRKAQNIGSTGGSNASKASISSRSISKVTSKDSRDSKVTTNAPTNKRLTSTSSKIASNFSSNFSSNLASSTTSSPPPGFSRTMPKKSSLLSLGARMEELDNSAFLSGFSNATRRAPEEATSGPASSNVSTLNTLPAARASELRVPTKPTDRYWTEIENPSQEIHIDLVAQVSRWTDIFPQKCGRKLIKWRSFQAPAALPVTTGCFPTTKELETQYTFQIYNVLLNYENYLELSTTHELMREMILLRLNLGFQVCYNDKVRRVEMQRRETGNTVTLMKYFPLNTLGLCIYMAFDDEIHRISCDSSANLTVQLYRKTRKSGERGQLEQNGEQKQNGEQRGIGFRLGLGARGLGETGYFPLIRTRYADDYAPARVDAINLKQQRFNWNQLDQFLAGYEDALPEGSQSFYRMKFVVMPLEVPKNGFYINNEQLSDEEIRVEGLRKLIALVQKGRFVNKKRPKADAPMSEIVFYTGNLYDFLNEEAENYDITGNKPALMVPENARFNKAVKLQELASELQGPAGINVADRTWHFKRHLDVFIGSDLVSWLHESFEDLESREDATEFGHTLMDRGLFKHVEGRHGLLDGYYFYTLSEEFADHEQREARKRMQNAGNSDSEAHGWFSKRKPDTSNSSDAELVGSPSLAVADTSDLRRITSMNLMNESESSSLAGSTHKQRKKKFILSRAVKYNVDPLNKSYRPELVNLHYDVVHNTEHCYHIRLEWLNTTTKFIDETVVNWSRLCERHGLSLIETPWEELCTIPELNPFHSFVDLQLVVNPWTDEEFNDPAILKENKFYYHLHLLRTENFYLDNRATNFFLGDNIEIGYSWGKPIFRNIQYIHETGTYFVELRNNGEFFMAPNNLHIKRLNSAVVSISDAELTPKGLLDTQRVMLNFRSTCQNHHRLREIFTEAKRLWNLQSKAKFGVPHLGVSAEDIESGTK